MFRNLRNRSRSFGMAATEALVFDAIRTPRGKGKVNGSLHSVKPVDLAVGLMHEMLVRNDKLDPNGVDDVVLGCVSPVGDQGSDIAKTAALKAARAREEGRFADSVIPVKDLNEHVVLDQDEFIRPGTTVETLGKLKPSFATIGEMGGFDAVALQKYHWVERIDHVHTPGNSSGIVDGASLVAIGNEKAAEKHSLTPRARILATALSGADPTIMLTRPAPASRQALEKAGLTVGDLDLVEINEAFAAVGPRLRRAHGADLG